MKRGKPDWWEKLELALLLIGGVFWWAILILMISEWMTWKI